MYANNTPQHTNNQPIYSAPVQPTVQFNPTLKGSQNVENQRVIESQVINPNIGHSKYPGTVPQGGEGGCCCAIF